MANGWNLIRAYFPELVVLLLLGFIYFLNASFFDIDTFSELYHIESAKEMFFHGQFAVPLFNQQDYLIRPPLWTWIVLGFFKTMGVQLWAARVPALLFSMLGLVFTYLIAGFLFQSRIVAVFSAIILATMWGYFYQSQLSTGDIMATVLSLGFIWSFLEWHPMSLRRHGVKYGEQGFAIAFGAMLGLLLLLKGLTAILLLVFVVLLYMVFTKTLHSLEAVKWKPLLLTFFGITLPWFLWVSIAESNPLFIWNYVIEQPLQRFVGMGSWEILHHDLLFYLFRLAGWLFPYTLILIAMFFDAGLIRRMNPNEQGWMKWLFFWFLSGFLIYSLSAFQEPSLLLPFYPPLAMMLGFYIGRMVEARDATPMYTKIISVYIIMVMVSAVLATIFTLHVLPDDYVGQYWRLPGNPLLTSIHVGIEIPLPSPFPIWKLWLLPAPFILIAGGVAMFLLMATRRPQLTGLTLCITSIVFLLFIKAIYLPVTYRPVPAHFAGILNKQVKPHDEILLYSLHPDVKRMLFYLKPEVNQRIRYATKPEELQKVLVDPPMDQTIYGVMRERNFYKLDYDYRRNLRINSAQWKWDNTKLMELWKFAKFQQPIFENMKFDLLLFQTLPQTEPLEQMMIPSEPLGTLKRHRR